MEVGVELLHLRLEILAELRRRLGVGGVRVVVDPQHPAPLAVVLVGDVVGPASATNNHVVFFDSTTGKLIKDSGLTLSGTNTGDATTTTEGALINGATAKTTPIDADFVGLMDSAASNILKKLSWLNVKATLKTYFDTLYATVGGGSETARVLLQDHAVAGD